MPIIVLTSVMLLLVAAVGCVGFTIYTIGGPALMIFLGVFYGLLWFAFRHAPPSYRGPLGGND